MAFEPDLRPALRTGKGLKGMSAASSAEEDEKDSNWTEVQECEDNWKTIIHSNQTENLS